MKTISYWMKRALNAEKELKKASVDAVFGIHSRFGIERMIRGWKGQKVQILFADLDDVHKLNERHGYQVIDARIRKAFQNIKQKLGKDEFLARWYSGDEWILISKDNPDRHVHDILTEFRNQDISLTIAASRCEAFSGKLTDLVSPASRRVQIAKKTHLKNKYWGYAA